MLDTTQNTNDDLKLKIISNRAHKRMSVEVTEKFIGALTELETAREDERLLALFAEDCEVGNIVVSEKFRGIAGARQFWKYYRATFRNVCSIIWNEIYAGNETTLEWMTEGKSKNGQKIKYEGISIMEIEAGKIKRFYAYFDSQDLGRQLCEQQFRSGAFAIGKNTHFNRKTKNFGELI